jgi:hypothetical protein
MIVHVIFNDSILAALDAISALQYMLLILIIIKLVIAAHWFEAAMQLDRFKETKEFLVFGDRAHLWILDVASWAGVFLYKPIIYTSFAKY